MMCNGVTVPPVHHVMMLELGIDMILNWVIITQLKYQNII